MPTARAQRNDRFKRSNRRGLYALVALAAFAAGLWFSQCAKHSPEGESRIHWPSDANAFRTEKPK